VLTDAQIDRYSRQIILSEVGGRGQERLLAARIEILAESADLMPALDYLAGAGIGRIHLAPADDDGALKRAATDIQALNPEVRVEIAPVRPAGGDTLMVLAGTDRIIEAVRRINRNAPDRPVIFGRLAPPHLIGILTSRPPCLRCAHPALLAEIQTRGASAAIVAMATAAETIKSLLAVAPQPSRLIEFNGYESRARQLVGPFDCPVCGG
jgi:molybdopterin-synthase adenylyltransferase